MRAVVESPSHAKAGIAGLVSQGLSSLSNVIMLIVAARSLTAVQFERYIWLGLAATFLMAGSRAVFVDAAVVKASDWTQRSGYLRILREPGVPLLLTGATLLLLIFAATTVSWLTPAAVVLVCVGYELLRASALATYDYLAACAADAGWVIWSATFLVAQIYGLFEPSTYLEAALVWACGATLSSLVVCSVLLKRRAATVQSTDTVTFRERLSMLLEFSLGTGSGYFVLWGAAMASSGVSLGAVRGIQSLAGPVAVLFSGTLTGLTPRLRDDRCRRCRIRIAALVSLGLGAVGAVSLTALSFLPTTAGTSLLGETWHATTALIKPFALYYMAMGATVGAVLFARSCGEIRQIALIRSLTLPPLLVGGILGAYFFGSRGLAWGLAGASVTNLAIWWGYGSRLADRVSHGVSGRPVQLCKHSSANGAARQPWW